MWEALLTGLDAYKKALARLKAIPDKRNDEAKTALLFKPASQITLIDGLLRAVDHVLRLFVRRVARLQPAAPVIRPHLDRRRDVASMALFGAAGQRDHQHLAVAAEIQSVSGPEIDPVFEHLRLFPEDPY